MTQTRHVLYTLGRSYFREAKLKYDEGVAEANATTAAGLFKHAQTEWVKARKKFEESKATAQVSL